MVQDSDVDRLAGMFRYLASLDRLRLTPIRSTAAYADAPDSQVVALTGLRETDDPSAALLTTGQGDAAHDDLFAAALAHAARPEELELVLALGLVRRSAPVAVARHAVVIPARLVTDADSGRISLFTDGDPIPELRGFLDPQDWPVPAADWEQRVRASRGGWAQLTPLLTELDAEPEPTLVLRRRSRQGISAVLERIAEQILAAGRVPPGLAPLLDPDRVPPLIGAADSDGAFVEVAGDLFGPLPLNAAQRRVVQRVASQAQVVVQGPPGTGKTHTIGALVSHLLAQGQRVLVTAPTDRALAQLRARLPAPLRPLAVSVLGTAEAELDELTEAVRRIADEATHDDPDARRTRIERARAELGRLGAERDACLDTLVAARAAETVEVPESGRPGTLAEVVGWHRAHEDRYGWVREFFEPERSWSPVGGRELLRFRRTARGGVSGAGAGGAAEGGAGAGDAEGDLQRRHRVAVQRAARYHRPELDRWLPGLRAMSPVQRREFAATLTDLRSRIAQLRQAPSAWTEAAVDSVLEGATTWRARATTVREVVTAAERQAEALGRTAQVRIEGPTDGLLELISGARDYASDHRIRLGADGRIKTGVLAGRRLRALAPELERIRVDGRVPTSTAQLDQVIAHLELERLLALADDQWEDRTQPSGDWRTRLDAHRIERDRLVELVRISDELGGIDEFAISRGWPKPDWAGFGSGQELLAAIEAIPDLDHEQAIARELARSQQETDRGRDRLTSEVLDWNPRLAAALGDPDESQDSLWEKRLRDFDAAWAWGRTDHWLAIRRAADSDRVRERLDTLDAAIVATVADLAAEQAWQHAVERLTPAARAALTAYAQQVRLLGRGTGKHAARMRREIRELLATARGAVPAWIMPLYRVAEQVEVNEHAFDVVIVDEASQAGIDALFLQYLAPRIVVVGDDKQVSPAGVGQDRDQLRTLAAEHLGDDLLAGLWTNPMRSLFDEATLRFGSRLVLTEHRRSVPEIVEFSNQIAYAAEGIRLQPVRQFGPLPPFRTVAVKDAGLARGNVNIAEVDAVVAEVTRLIADPAYAGMSLGVVSLLGQEQSRAIAARLQHELPAEVWSERRLQVGEPPAFQGSERDVMVVSMVAAPSARLVAQTREVAVQRYNVAISRARDQVILVHSVTPADLSNPEDLRRQLLEHALGVEQRTSSGSGAAVPGELRAPVGDTVLVPPFTSLLQQRIADAVLEQGYRVSAGEMVQGQQLDLVVHGTRGRVAVDAESAQWAGAAAYRSQLVGHRDLERGGWRFVRITESAWAADPAAALQPLWEALGIAAIEPVTRPVAAVSRAAGLEEYRVFAGPVSPGDDLSVVLPELVAVEGPVVGQRLAEAYAGAAGLRRVEGALVDRLGAGLAAAVSAGELIEDDPRDSADWRERVYRRPNQPEARARHVGPRRLSLIPLSEAALLLDLVTVRRPAAAEEERFLAVLEHWGLPRRLSESAREYLRTADRLG